MKTTLSLQPVTAMAVIFLAITLMACDKRIRKNGSGVVTTVTKNLETFSDVDMDGSYELVVHQGNESKITITTDDNIQSEVQAFVQDGKLFIEMSDDYFKYKYTQMQVHVYSGNFNRIDMNGSINMQCPDTIFAESFVCSHNGNGNCVVRFSGENLQLDINGTATMQSSGQTDNIHAEINGSGKIEALDVESADGVAKIRGTGNIYINCSENLNASIVGSGNIRYLGNPDVTSSIDGSGSISAY